MRRGQWQSRKTWRSVREGGANGESGQVVVGHVEGELTSGKGLATHPCKYAGHALICFYHRVK